MPNGYSQEMSTSGSEEAHQYALIEEILPSAGALPRLIANL